MSTQSSNYALDQKITNIRDTLQRLTSNYKHESETQVDSQIVSQGLSSPDLNQLSEQAPSHRENLTGLKSSYSVDDLSSVIDMGGTLNTAEFESHEDSPIKTQSTYDFTDPTDSIGFAVHS